MESINNIIFCIILQISTFAIGILIGFKMCYRKYCTYKMNKNKYFILNKDWIDKVSNEVGTVIDTKGEK